MAKEEKKMVTVVARQTSRWRAGLQFGAEPREVEVTEKELAQIEADPMLAIVAKPDEKKAGSKS